MVPSKEIVGKVRELLDSLRCGEPHNTGFGCCRCDTNEIIDDIISYLQDPDAPWFNIDHFDECEGS